MRKNVLKINHHSVADWDFTYGTSYRYLDPSMYVSPPTSIRFYAPSGSYYNIVLCRIAAVQNVPQGELRHWIRKESPTYQPFYFRNQAALGTANRTNTYAVLLHDNIAEFCRWISGGFSQRATTPCTTPPINTWTHWRLVWWNGYNYAGEPCLCVRVFKEVASEWVQQGETMFDTDNTWKDSSINRCGLCGAIGGGYKEWFDDTEIWTP